MGIIALIVIFIIVILFQQKINKLENQIDDLNARINHIREELDQKNQCEKTSHQKLQSENIPSSLYHVEMHETSPPLSKLTSANEIPQHLKSNPSPLPSAPTFIERTIDFLKENFLTIVGIITLVLGIGYFVKYAIDQNWINETLRVVIGIGIGFLIIGTGHYLRKKYSVFSSIVVGGGISVLYFTLTIAFREYHMFAQQLTFVLLAFVTLLSIILSYIYNQQTLVIFSILGGFAAPLMVSTGESNYIFLFTYLGILNLGTLFIAWKKDWIVIRFIAFILSALFFIFWAVEPTHQVIFLFLMFYYFMFTISSLLPYLKGKPFDTKHIILYIAQNFYFVAIGILSYTHYYTSFISIAPFIAMVTNFIVLGLTYRKDGVLNNVSLSLVIAWVTLCIGIEFDAHIIPILWAIQSTLLLYLWKRLNNPIFKVGFIALVPFFIISLCINWSNYIFNDTHYALIFNPIFTSSSFVFICSIINIYLIKDFQDTERIFGFNLYSAKNVFSIVSILFMYLGLLFEIIYQTDKYFSAHFVAGIALLYSIYFISIILMFNRAFNINTYTKYSLGIINFGLMLIYPLIIQIHSEILLENQPLSYYIFYLLYVIPFGYFSFQFFNQSEFRLLKKNQFNQWFVFIVSVFIISYELFNFYMIVSTPRNDLQTFNHHETIYRMVILPIVWAIMGFALINFGYRKGEKNLPLMGFGLFGLIVIKLYVIDVWEMSSGLRVISFIVLGMLILLTSFMYQKLKRVFNQLFEAQDEKKGES